MQNHGPCALIHNNHLQIRFLLFDVDGNKFVIKNRKKPETGQIGSRHLTDQSIDGDIRISDCIKIIRDEFKSTMGLKISVASKKSALYPQIPLYKW